MNRLYASAFLVTFLLASVDLIFACTYWHQLFGVSWSRLVQNIASGLLGKRSFEGGTQTVALGLLLHYLMMAMMVGAFYVASTRMPALNERPWQSGLLYGAVLFVVMNLIVVPLSAAPKAPIVPSWIAASIVVHLLIGVAIAHGARSVLRAT